MKTTIERRANEVANDEGKVSKEMETRIPGATKNLWDSQRAQGLSELETLAYRSMERAGFEAEAHLGTWMYDEFVPSERARKVYRLLAKVRPLAQLGVGDLWAVGTAPPR